MGPYLLPLGYKIMFVGQSTEPGITASLSSLPWLGEIKALSLGYATGGRENEAINGKKCSGWFSECQCVETHTADLCMLMEDPHLMHSVCSQ